VKSPFTPFISSPQSFRPVKNWPQYLGNGRREKNSPHVTERKQKDLLVCAHARNRIKPDKKQRKRRTGKLTAK
jgi:hypothetical protein